MGNNSVISISTISKTENSILKITEKKKKRFKTSVGIIIILILYEPGHAKKCLGNLRPDRIEIILIKKKTISIDITCSKKRYYTTQLAVNKDYD